MSPSSRRSLSRILHSVVEPPSIRVVPRVKAGGSPDYRELDKPTYVRQRVVNESVAPPPPPENEELLDIPAFLRRQAD